MQARTNHPFRILTLCAVAAFAPLFSHAAVQNRVAGINGNNRVALPNTIPARVRRATDMGAAPASRRLSSVTVRFSMTPDQQAALSQLLLDQQNPSSPRYHQWLTTEQFGAQFGLSSSDIAQVSAWLTSQGLTITSTSPSSNFITVSGTIAQVQQAFGTSIHSLTLNGEPHIGNITDPVLPAAVANVVSTITGLNDFHPRPHIRPNVVRPAFTSSQTLNHYMAPGDFYTIYDVNPLLNAGINGTGITIAVMGQVDVSTSDIAAFRAASGLAASTPTVRVFGPDPGSPTSACLSSGNPNCTPSASDLSESQIDTEWAGALAPSANILFVTSQDVIDVSLMNAITSNVAPILSISYGACEDPTAVNGFAKTSVTSMDQLFQQANAQGQTIVSASGDAGATDCDGDAGNYPASLGLSVDFPASSPHVTGMGGTMFNDGTATGATNYWSASNGAYNGSAISYIPELPWNESGPPPAGLGGGGGGASIFFTKPSWQTGTGVPADGARDVPDIAFNAASAHDGYLYCAMSFCVTGFRYSNGTLTEAGGTSFGAPIFSGVLALLEQKTGAKGLGNINPTLYAVANSTYYNNAFHDITSGNNNSPCTSGSVNCPAGTSSIGYTAGVGYDQATGWGSLDVFNFVNEWGLVTALGSGTTSGNASVVSVAAAPSTTVTAGTAITLTGTVTSGLTGLTTAPTGTISILVDNAANGSPTNLSNGVANYSLNTSALTSGSHTVTVNYSGDNLFATSSGTLLINITSATAADFTLTCSTTAGNCSSNGVSATSGAPSTAATFTIAPVNGFTGSVALSATLPASLAATGSFTVSPVVITTAAGSTVFTLATTKATTQTTTVLPNLHAAAQAPPAPPAAGIGMHLFVAGGGAALAGLLFLGLPRRRRFASLLGVFLSIAALSSIGCSSSVNASSSSSGSTGTGSSGSSGTGTGTTTTTTTTANASPGSYVITVTATSGNVTHSSNVTLVVH
jgi:subtilase family serine protease